MSAVSKKLIPASSAAWTTLAVPAASSRPPKLLHPSPTTDTFNEPIQMMQKWRKVANPLLETVCAENNNDAEFFHQKLPPMPIAAKADF